MAAGRDALRFTTFVPLLEDVLDNPQDCPPTALFEDLGTLPELLAKAEELLQFALDHDQPDRVERLLGLQSRLASLELQAIEIYGEDIDRNLLRVSRQNPLLNEPPPPDESNLEAENPLNNPLNHPLDDHPPSEPISEMECPICFERLAIAEARGLVGCRHLYCAACLVAHFSSKIGERKVAEGDLACPTPGCGVQAGDLELRALVEPECFERLQAFRRQDEELRTSLARKRAQRECPNASCGALVDPSEGAKEGLLRRCGSCATEFCGGCGTTPFHAGVDCDTALQARAGSVDPLRAYIQQVGTAVKPCPQCGEAIEKNSGCMSFIFYISFFIF